MSTMQPKGEDLRRAVQWVSQQLKDNPDQNLNTLVNKAIFRFNLSPKDGEFLLRFFKQSRNKT